MDENWMIGDLHIHSKYSRACSKDLTIPNLVKWAKIKGLNLLGTGDFTHPIWFKEIQKLKEKEGFYYYEDFPFIITGEVSLIYTQESKGRKVHLVILVPNLDIAEKINSYLDNNKFRRDYDGRPIFGISCDNFVKAMMEISKDIEIIPAHIWTPHFGVFGSMSGFDSLKEAFVSQAENIHSIETGISSDPEMNWKIKELKDKSIVSFSDAHSFWPWRLGREATIFKKTNSYLGLLEQIRNNDFIGTIEVEPAYGKYHWDGHAVCKFSCSPQQTKNLNGICPVCNKKLIVGVENRVEKLSNNNFKGDKLVYKILPLHEIISLAYGVGLASKKIWDIYNPLIQAFENEFEILLNVSPEELQERKTEKKLIDLIIRNREARIKVNPGYDGEYGVAVLEEQGKLF